MKRFLLSLAGGPCAGTYEVDHAPKAMRAVRGPGGQLAVLDVPEDVVGPDEELHVYTWDYRRGKLTGHGFICGRGGGQQFLQYRYLGPGDPATGEVLEPLDEEESGRLADEWTRAQAAQFLLDTPRDLPGPLRDNLQRVVAGVNTKAASPQGALF